MAESNRANRARPWQRLVPLLLCAAAMLLQLPPAVGRAAAEDEGAPANIAPSETTRAEHGSESERETDVEHEDERIGPNRQPEWSTRRRFSQTRIYVLPPWELDLYTTWRIRKLRQRGEEEEEGEEPEGEPGEEPSEIGNLLSQEFELGLPYRFQVEYSMTGTNDAGDWEYQEQAIGLRWAAADWGEVPFNPTLLAVWKFRNGEADFYETRLLLGDEIAPAWHAGANIFFEQQVGEQREQEIVGTLGASYSVIDEKLGIGVEAELKGEREAAEEDSDFEFRGLLGPSLQWSPLKNIFVDVVPLFGLSDKSPVIESFIVLGLNFNTPD